MCKRWILTLFRTSILSHTLVSILDWIHIPKSFMSTRAPLTETLTFPLEKKPHGSEIEPSWVCFSLPGRMNTWPPVQLNNWESFSPTGVHAESWLAATELCYQDLASLTALSSSVHSFLHISLPTQTGSLSLLSFSLYLPIPLPATSRHFLCSRDSSVDGG